MSTFGDGVNGALLPTGTNNVVATYRYGAGAAAPAVETLTVIQSPQPGLEALRNPLQPTGGADADDPARAEDPRAAIRADLRPRGRQGRLRRDRAHAPAPTGLQPTYVFDPALAASEGDALGRRRRERRRQRQAGRARRRRCRARASMSKPRRPSR